ncbi:hypothetical protein ACF044_11435 [Microbacterium sp. NPDC016588]
MTNNNTVSTDEQTPDVAKAEPRGVERLRLARERAAALRAADPVDDRTVRQVEVGDVVHALAPIMIHRSASIWGGEPALALRRADSFVVTAVMLAADVNVHGKPGWSILVHDEDAQLAKWGRVMLAPGEAPDNMEPWEHGDAFWKEARNAARDIAFKEPDETKRRELFAEISRRYGPGRD